MKKFLFIVFVFLFNINIIYSEEFNITSKEVLLYNLNDDSIIYELNKDKIVPVASLTKIMTTIIAIENIDNLDDKVTLTSDIFKGLNGYSKAGFNVGDKLTYKDLLYGIILTSGADAVNAIVKYTVGDLDSFVTLMNNKASSLGMNNTYFDNAIGADSINELLYNETDEEDYTNYSTAYDISILLKYALTNETFKEIFTTKEYKVSSGLLLESTLNNHYTIDTSLIIGSKSGFTDLAGLCLASIYSYNNVDYLLVTLGADTNDMSSAVKDSMVIYNYYSSNYEYIKLLDKDMVIKTIPVKWGKTKEYDITSSDDIILYINNNIDVNELEYNYNGIEEISNDIKKGSVLGTVDIVYDGVVLTTIDVYLNSDIDYYYPLLYVFIIFLIIFIYMKLRYKKRRKRR